MPKDSEKNSHLNHLFSKRKVLEQRQRVVRAIRDDLYLQGFLELEAPLLVKKTCPDTEIDSIKAGDGYLVTSTEYQIKRMIGARFEKVFTLTKNFRQGESGKYHSPEFSMLEWGRASATMFEIEEDSSRIIKKAFSTLYPNHRSICFQGTTLDILNEPWEKITVRDALKAYLGLENLEDFSAPPLEKALKKSSIYLPDSFKGDKHLLLSYVMDLLQPHLGQKSPTFLQEWPIYMTSSAPTNQKDPYAATRTELYIAGVEIGNGFPFLTNSETQKKLFIEANQRRKERGKEELEWDKKYLETLDWGLPEGAGMALGLDRLMMVLTDSSHISDVQAFSWDEL